MKRTGFKKRQNWAQLATDLRTERKIKLKLIDTSSKGSLHKKAWKIFGDWIKRRDSYICVTCGSRDANQAGHFWHGVLDFDEVNINTQCKQCNHFKYGNLAPYSIYLIRKYGQKAFEDLEKRHWLALTG